MILAVVGLLAPIPMAPAVPGGPRPCLDVTPVRSALAAAPLRFGITPAGQAGQLGPPARATPERPERTLGALERLRTRRGPFVIRLNRFFWSSGEEGIKRYLSLTRRYAREGYQVELQLRYHPRPEQEGDIAGFTDWVRTVTRRFGRMRRVVGVQVTNEVNLTLSPDSSDGAFEGAREALIEGVVAAKDEAETRGFDQLKVGFNWFYRTDPANEGSFWRYLRDNGGQRFASSVDWVGLDAFPGTHFPPAAPAGTERDAMVNAIGLLRHCYLPVAGIGNAVPIHVQENGFPTGPGRGATRQALALETMVRTVHEYRTTFNVSDYRWFDLRDADSSSPNIQQHYGLLRDDYDPKPAFAVFRRLVAELSVVPPPGPPAAS